MNDHDLKYWLGLVAAVAMAVAGNTHLLPEPYNHIAATVGELATAMLGYKITPSGSSKNYESKFDDQSQFNDW